MMVKICGITALDDALAAVDAGASAIGFNFYTRSPRYITPEAAAQIALKLPSDILQVGVFVNEAAAEMERIGNIVKLDVVQLHGDERPDEMPVLPRVWKAFRVTPEWTLQALEDWSAEAFLLDGPAPLRYGGSGTTFDWTSAVSIHKHIIVAGGLDASNVQLAIQQSRPWGVDACSRLESAPGKKDREKMRQFVKAALAEI